MRVRWVSALLGRMSQKCFGYVTFLVLNGTSSFGMKYIVLVPSIRFLTPWAKRPNSLVKYLVRISLSRPLMMWRNSWSTPVSGFRTAFTSKLFICLAALAYCALITAGCWCHQWRNGYRWVFGALLGGVLGLRDNAIVASCWWFLCSALGGVGVSGGILCTLLSDWFGGGGVILSRSGAVAVMGGTFGVTVMGGIVTLGNNGATLGGATGSCFDASVGTCCCVWTVARWKVSASWSRSCIWASPMCAYGAAGAGLKRACISYVATIVAFSAEDRNGIFELCGRNSTVAGCITALVSGTYIL